jgi:hypothetical protein
VPIIVATATLRVPRLVVALLVFVAVVFCVLDPTDLSTEVVAAGVLFTAAATVVVVVALLLLLLDVGDTVVVAALVLTDATGTCVVVVAAVVVADDVAGAVGGRVGGYVGGAGEGVGNAGAPFAGTSHMNCLLTTQLNGFQGLCPVLITRCGNISIHSSSVVG